MLTSVADWSTEAITYDFSKSVQLLTVGGDFENCDPHALRRSLAEYIGVAYDNVFAAPTVVVIAAPLATFMEPTHYRALVDEAVSEAERDTLAVRDDRGGGAG